MAYIIPQEQLIPLTAERIRAMMAAQGVQRLVGAVEVHQEPGQMHHSVFSCVMFDGAFDETYRCDELLNQLKMTVLRGTGLVILTLVDGEVRLEYDPSRSQPADCGKVVARCRLS